MAGVAPDAAFTLTSLDGRPAAALASRLIADPPIAFVVRAGTGDTAIATPTRPLAAGALYRISLTRPDGSVEASWAARTPGPLHVDATVPGDAATRVPTDTGIEIRFDQDGVTAADLKAHFSISPATAGHFEASGRSIAFVPSQQLRKGTLYTVTVAHGLPIAGTGQVLAKDQVIRFETASTATQPVARVAFRRSLSDATPRERAALGIWVNVPEDAKAPAKVPLTVHRLPGIGAAVAAWRAAASAPDWTEVARAAPIATTGLTRVASATVAIRTSDNFGEWIQLPGPLPVGWYVVTVTAGGVPHQAVLQVTDAATFALVATDRTAVWVNDLRTGKPAVGATATVDGRSLAGRTDARGLLTTATPATVRSATDSTPMLIVRYRGLETFQPIAGCTNCYDKGGNPVAETADPWWSYLATDRRQYRSTDTINAYGIVRDRASGTVPGAVTVAVYTGYDDGPDLAPVVSARVTPDARGMFHGALPLRDLPVGSYRLVATTGSTDIRETWFDVITIRKPAFTIAVSTNRHAILSGASVTTSVHAAFFEGTPFAGSAIRLMEGYYEGSDESTTLARVTTSTDGDASGKVVLHVGDGDQWSVTEVSAVPALPEEAEIHDSTQVAVFRSTAVLSADGTVTGGRVVTTGSVNSVVWSRFETAAGQADPWSVDPAGAGRANAAVRVSTIAHIPYRVQHGTAYDFITKRVAPVYEWKERLVTLPARTVRTGADGRYRVAIATYPKAASYEITASYTDEGGRRVTAGAWANTGARTDSSTNAWLENAGPGHDDGLYSVGDAVRVAFTGGIEKPPVARYLFMITGAGLRYATVGTSPTFRTTFTADSVPSIGIRAVRFNGAGFEVADGRTASLRLDDRRLAVQVTPDRARYEPGGTASVTIRTLDPAGRPVVASVFVGVVDEKLYAMGAASEDDALATLYDQQPDGVIAEVVSHRTVADGRYGYGDTTGGGQGGDTMGPGRKEFKDWLLARIVTTDTDGRATVAVPLSDDLTSWRAVATALDARLEAGSGSASIAVGLPFFVDGVLANEYLASDHPVLRVRSYGTSLPSSAKVTFTISSDTLPMSPVTVTADAFHAAEVPLPGLSVGSHRLRIAGETGTGTARLADVMTRTFTVVTTRATQLRTTWAAVTAPMSVSSGSSLTGITLVDAGRGRVIPLLQELAIPDFTRSDRVLASALANRVLVEQFGLTAVAPTPEDGLDPFLRYDGVSIVPWSSTELDVSVLAAMSGDKRANRDQLGQMLQETVANTELPRERRLLALAGLAALDEPVLGDVRAAAALTDLGVDEQVHLALAALFAGDEALAGRIEQQVLEAHGFRRGGQVRIDPASPADPSVVTARLAIVAASLGDPVAADMDAWLADNPPAATTIAAERALAARGWAMRVAGATSAVTLTVDGQRRQVTVEPGSPVALALTPAQAASARLEPVSGAVLLVQTWDDALTPVSLHTDGDVALTRAMSPTGTIRAADTVLVTLTVTLEPSAAKGCWRVVDHTPSGLAPIAGGGSPEGEWTGERPDRVDGQRVEFCVGVNPRQPVHTLSYLARVVSPGTYTWEPTVLQSTFDPGLGIVLKPATVKIAGAGG